MRTRGGLAARVARIEETENAACPTCKGKPMRLEWERDWLEPETDTRAKLPAAPDRCEGCGRPVQVVKVRWKTDADPEGA